MGSASLWQRKPLASKEAIPQNMPLVTVARCAAPARVGSSVKRVRTGSSVKMVQTVLSESRQLRVNSAKTNTLSRPTGATHLRATCLAARCSSTTTRSAMSRVSATSGDGAVADATGVDKKIRTRMAEYPTSGTFSTMAAAWDAVGFIDAPDGFGPFTVFAPTDDAWAAYAAELGLTAEEVVASAEDHRGILEHHNFLGQYTVAELLAMELPMTMTGVSCRFDLTIDKTAEGKLLVAGCEVVLSDVMTANGIIHGINGVITDVTPELDQSKWARPPSKAELER